MNYYPNFLDANRFSSTANLKLDSRRNRCAKPEASVHYWTPTRKAYLLRWLLIDNETRVEANIRLEYFGIIAMLVK